MNLINKSLNKIGLGKALAVFSVTVIASGFCKPAGAVGVLLGSDYFITQPGTSFNFGDGFGTVNFTGNPLGNITIGNRTVNAGQADTIIERLDDVSLPNVGSSGSSRLQVAALSLRSVAPVNGFNVFVNLTPGSQPIGTITINHENSDTAPTQGTFSSDFTVNFTTSFQPVGGGTAICPPQLQTCSFSRRLTGSGSWSHTFQGGTRVEGPVGDQLANVHTNPPSNFKDFFPVGTIEEMHPEGTQHKVSPVPEPLTIVGSGLALGFGALFKKEYSRKRKKQKVS